MAQRYFPESELIINKDGSCFHLHLKPEQLADKVILVGDPERVNTVADHSIPRSARSAIANFILSQDSIKENVSHVRATALVATILTSLSTNWIHWPTSIIKPVPRRLSNGLLQWSASEPAADYNQIHLPEAS